MAGYATLRMTESRVETPWALAFANGTRDRVWLWFGARYMTERDAQMLRVRGVCARVKFEIPFVLSVVECVRT